MFTLLIIAINWIYLMQGIKYETSDDMVIAVSGWKLWYEGAFAQGRLCHLINAPMAMLPYLLDNNIYLTSI